MSDGQMQLVLDAADESLRGEEDPEDGQRFERSLDLRAGGEAATPHHRDAEQRAITACRCTTQVSVSGP